ncbi:MAG: hypothetical protein GY757_21030 [bacterium]|nr:hypothetical protein [bacterium]
MKKFAVVLFLTVFVMFTFAAAAEQFIDKATIDNVTGALLKKHGEQNKFRIETGVKQAAKLWTEKDGSKEVFAGLCQQYFISSPELLEKNFKRMETNSEVLAGYFTEMIVDLKLPLSLDMGEILPLDMAFGQFNPAAHIEEDMFDSKLAFFSLLNFPHYSLEEKNKLGPKWTRKEWAYARRGDGFTSRTPSKINQDVSAITTMSRSYINSYNVFMGKLVDEKQKTYFPEKLKLISHWGLRDEIRGRYNDPEGLFKQEMIYKVMERIIAQEIPKEVINKKDHQWNPYTNKLFKDGKEVKGTPETDVRYARFIKNFQALKKYDPYNPYLPSHIKRSFEAGRELTEEEVEALFVELLSSKEAMLVADLLRKRFKRELKPFDIWYEGFKGNTSVSEEELNKIVSKKYPNLEAFRKGIPEIMVKLGFAQEKADFVGSKIRVDPARGAGHCAGAAKKDFSARLRTRVPKGGMDYKGYNTAMHELGHAVEQTLTLQDIDYYSLNGVPNTAFTEAFAFVFQDRDLEVLGLKKKAPEDKHLKALSIFWNAYEIMGVSLVDMKIWRWLYENPNATPVQLKEKMLTVSKEIWNKYFAPVFKVKDQTLLGIYSHMISNPLYLPNYPIGHVIQFQIEEYLEGKNLAKEMQRMLAAGSIIPQQWMRNAVNSEISVKPLLKAVREAVKHIKK